MGAIVGTRSGKVEGIERHGIHVFRGIPFAAPPVGPRRWRAPEREEPWDGVRDATSFSPQSAQAPFGLAQFLGGDDVPASEDSLYLNVWTPGLDAAHRPVLVWIHGGAFMNGAGATPWYSGTRFAQRGCVVVTINYRLAAFGFLHLADLFGPGLAGSGNAGILDQVAALEWVRDNIAAFGGDPDNVTVFGESAGGASVGALLGMPAARGLFQGAIPQSGAASWCARPDDATEFAARVVDALGVQPGDLDALQAKTADEVIAAQTTATANLARAALPFRPVVDGATLPVAPLTAIAAGSAAGVRVLVGTNRHEMTLFHLWDPSLGDLDDTGLVARAERMLGGGAMRLVEGYRARRPGVPERDVWCDLSTDNVFRLPAIRLAEAQLAHGPVWMYLFTWETPVFEGKLQSTHALEIPFVFDTVHQRGAAFLTGEGEDRQDIADAMHGAWVAFAHHGDPNHAGLPEWPRYDPARRATMRFDTVREVLDDPEGDDRRAWDGVTTEAALA